MNSFLALHPSITFIYFIVLIVITMFSTNPIILLTSLIASVFIYGNFFGFLGKEAFFKQLKHFFFIILICTVFNPIFSQNGTTVLFNFKILGLKITAQSLLFGLSIGVMIVCSLLWFLCLSKALSSQKILYLFGKRTPKIALTISLTLKLIPEFIKKFKSTAQSQKALGLYGQNKLKDRIKSASEVFLSVCLNVLESSAQTSDSMRARGFGVNNYCSYCEYKIYKADIIFGVFTVFLTVLFSLSSRFGNIKFYYYPTLSPLSTDIFSILCYASFACLAFLPFTIILKEEITWKYSMSKI